MESWLALPQEDGGCPFSLVFSQGSHEFLVMGVLGHAIAIIEKPEDWKAGEHGFVRVDISVACGFLKRAFSTNSTEEWMLLRPLLPSVAPGKDLPMFVPELTRPTLRLRSPECGAYYSFTEEHLKEAMAALVLASKQQSVATTLIESAVETLADLSLDRERRVHWQLTMEVIAELARIKQDVLLEKQALHTASGFAMGFPGSQIPFVRDWAELTLLSATAMARMTEKAKHQDLKD